MIRGAITLIAILAILTVLSSATSASDDNTWMDRTHAWIEEDLTGTIRWFDRFFTDDRQDPVEYTESSLRVTNDFRWDEAEDFTYRLRVRARIRLPRLKGKWSLLISGENKGDPNPTRPEDPGNPGLDVLTTNGRASTEAAYYIVEERNTLLFVGAGIRIRTDPSVFLRTRFLHGRELAYSVIGRLSVTPYWDSEDGFGETNEVVFERPFSSATLLRSSSFTAIKESEKGWALGTELEALHKLSAGSGITFGGSLVYRTRPVAAMENYRVFARYRRNFLRSWLFYELEPDVNWRRQDDGSRDTILGGTVRLEVNFIGRVFPD